MAFLAGSKCQNITILCACTLRGKLMFLLQVEVRGQPVSFLVVDGEKWGDEDVSRTRATKMQREVRSKFLGTQKKVLDPVYKHVRPEKKFKVCVCSSFSHKDMLLIIFELTVVWCFYTSFFLSLVINKLLLYVFQSLGFVNLVPRRNHFGGLRLL